MIDPRLRALAADFWAAAGGAGQPPRDLQGAVALALPVTTVTLPALAVSRVEGWLLARGIDHRLHAADRRLRGCLVATRGAGFIFIDGADPEDERRFTLAHEIAHYLLDYQAPRERAMRLLGAPIAAAFDGRRPPTVDERLGAALTRSHLGVATHLMERAGDVGARVAAIEARADRLAWELLAPAAAFVAGDLIAGQEDLAIVLRDVHGLPGAEAQRYARRLHQEFGPPPSYVGWLRG